MLIKEKPISTKKTKKAAINFVVPMAFYDELSQTAQKMKISRKAVLYVMIDSYLKNNSKPTLEDYEKQSSLSSINEQELNLTNTNDKIKH